MFPKVELSLDNEVRILEEAKQRTLRQTTKVMESGMTLVWPLQCKLALVKSIVHALHSLMLLSGGASWA